MTTLAQKLLDYGYSSGGDFSSASACVALMQPVDGWGSAPAAHPCWHGCLKEITGAIEELRVLGLVVFVACGPGVGVWGLVGVEKILTPPKAISLLAGLREAMPGVSDRDLLWLLRAGLLVLHECQIREITPGLIKSLRVLAEDI